MIDIDDSLPFNIVVYMANKKQRNSETDGTKYQEESIAYACIVANEER